LEGLYQESPVSGSVGALSETVVVAPPSAETTLLIHAEEAVLQTIAFPSTRSDISTFERLSKV
jgi:hypothetical protein